MIILDELIRTVRTHSITWDAWTADNTYVRLRYTHGLGLVHVDPSNNSRIAAQFDLGDDASDDITLDEFLAHVADKVQLAPDAEIRDDRRGPRRT